MSDGRSCDGDFVWVEFDTWGKLTGVYSYNHEGRCSKRRIVHPRPDQPLSVNPVSVAHLPPCPNCGEMPERCPCSKCAALEVPGVLHTHIRRDGTHLVWDGTDEEWIEWCKKGGEK